MDATAEQFATRCLPLNVANAHGWEVLSPCGFDAYWNGRLTTDGVVIRPDPGHNVELPISMFGDAIMSFHISAIFRTSPGWDLFITGPTNSFKEGIAPLSGVIETDWSPYSFTMNWKLLRRNHTVRFEAGEPMCFFFPVQRGVLEKIEPKFAPLHDDPDLERQFHAWCKSRYAFKDEMKRDPRKAPADKWQKRYYRGIDMDEKQGAADHIVKLRLKPFTPTRASDET